MGIEVLGISCITNLAAGVLPQPLNHEEVLETAKRVRGKFISLLNGIIAGRSEQNANTTQGHVFRLLCSEPPISVLSAMSEISVADQSVVSVVALEITPGKGERISDALRPDAGPGAP